MSYASILVAVDLAPRSRSRVRLAGRLADAFGAGLIGVAAEQPAYAIPPLGATAAGAYALAAASEVVHTDLRIAQAAFEEEAGARDRTEWRAALDFPLSFLAAQAAAADLVIVGRAGEAGASPFAFNSGDAVMRLGRPVLVVPPEVDHLDAARVTIGWKNTREARRAVSDALPLLRRAAHVAVVSVDEGQGAPDGQDVVALLTAHGVAATALCVEAAGDATSRALIDTALEQGADLIVTGAYGHGRLREWVFGGVTRTLLAASPVCCLMSH